jgi:hypothetical protein
METREQRVVTSDSGEGADFTRYGFLAFEVLEGVGIAPFAWRFGCPSPQAREKPQPAIESHRAACAGL